MSPNNGRASITLNSLGNTSMATNITSKGQVTIPKRVRDAMGIKAGAKVTVDYVDGAAVVKPLSKTGKSDIRKKFEAVRGTLDLDMTTDEFMKLMRGDD